MPDEAFPDVHALHPVCYSVLWQTSGNRRLFYCIMQISQHYLRFVQNLKLLFFRLCKFLIINNANFTKNIWLVFQNTSHIFEKVPCNFSCVGNALKIFLYFPEIPRIFTARPGLSVLEQRPRICKSLH